MPPKKRTCTKKFLVIVESPSKTSKIEHFLGDDYQVIASKGHLTYIRGLKSILVKEKYHVNFDPILNKRSHIEEIRGIVSQYPRKNIIIATDNDREGEAIGYHLCQLFELPVATTPRIIFNEITEDALRNAVRSPTHINMDLVQSQIARQIIDVFIGFKISPILWKHVSSSKSNSLSAGRCQTPALRLIYDNYLKGKDEETWGEQKYKTVGHFFPTLLLACDLNHEFTKKDEVRKFLDLSKTFSHTFTLGDLKKSVQKAPVPLNTSKLLQTASHALHVSPKEVMQLAQQLYQEGHITYHRTESTKYSQDFLDKVRPFLVNTYGKNNENILGDFAAISNAGSALPHEAIRVTSIPTKTITTNNSRLDSLYRFIWKHTMESCMANAIYDVHKVTIQAPMELHYTHALQIPVFMGWKLVSRDDSHETGKENGHLLYLKSVASKNAPYTYIESTLTLRKLHAHYTESGLIQTLEDLGIGRPSTYSVFVETILERGYVEKKDIDGKTVLCTDFTLREGATDLQEKISTRTFGQEKGKLVIQPLGILCIEFLLQHFLTVFEYSYTKNIEEELDTIARPLTDSPPWYTVCETTRQDISLKVKEVTKMEKQVFTVNDTHDVIFQSHGPCIRKRGCVDDRGMWQEDLIEYLPIKSSCQMDLDKLKQGVYSLDELALYKQSFLGMYQDAPIFIRKGPYGFYLEWRDHKKTLSKREEDEIAVIDVSSAIAHVDPSVVDESSSNNSKILRILNDEMSVRQGKFGNYIYYKSPTMKTPKFINIKKFDQDCLSCDPLVLIEWATTHQLGTKPKYRKYTKK